LEQAVTNHNLSLFTFLSQ